MRMPHPARVRVVLAVVGVVACGAVLTGGVVSPSWAEAAERPDSAEQAVLGGFALGDGVEGMIDPRSGAFSFALPVAGVSLGWDSRAAGVDRSGLGEGWSVAGVAKVDTEGGMRVSPASGGVFVANASVPSGLEGYLLGDVVFRQGHVQVPASADGSRGAVDAAFELVELGGVRTFFSAEGDPVVRLDANDNRSDWSWEPGHRLVRATDVSGVTTTLDWSDPGRVQVVTGAGASQVTGAVEVDGGRVSAVVDATGGRVRVGYTPAGLVKTITAVAGAATEVSWQALVDGQTAVDRVRVIEQATGAELSARQWTAQAGLASGWPAQQVPAVAGSAVSGSAVAGSGVADSAGSGSAVTAGAGGYVTAVTDGSSTVVSEFDGLGLLLTRTDTRPDPTTDGPDTGTPATTTAYTYDGFDRLTLALDGTRYTYDATNQPVTETTPDGVTIRTGYWASGQRATHTQDDTTAATVFHWDGTTLLNDTHTSPEASGTAAYLLGVGRHARTLGSPASTVFSEADFHGNVTELTGPDANVTTSYDYTDYGVTTTRQHTDDEHDAGPLVGDAHRNPFQYAGEYTNPTGTQHLQVRTYDPATMRLTSVDPEPQHNRYHYAALNPITLADPTGRIPDLPDWGKALLAGVGLALALTGFGTAISAVATASSIGAMTIGTKAVLLGTGIVAAYDLTATVLDTVDVFMPEFLDDQTALILGATSVGAGAATAIAGIGARALTRVDINRTLALGPGVAENEARHLVEWAGRIAKQGQDKLSKFGITADRRDLARSLNDRIVEDLRTSEPGWTYSGHRAELEKFDNMVKDWEPSQQVRPNQLDYGKNMGAKKVHVDSGLGKRMRNVVAADAFAAMWQSRALTTQVRNERDSIAKILESSQQSNANGQEWLYPRGANKTVVYVPGYQYLDKEGFIMWDNHFFGWGVRWKYQHRASGHEV